MEYRDWKEAAVLVLRYRENGLSYLVLTRRTEEVFHHKGQICFPGGARDPRDKSLWETALRESQEEIGLDPGRVTLIRELSRQRTPSGFEVTPFLASIEEPPPLWTPNPVEIAEIFSIPLDHLRDPKNFRFVKRTPSFSYGHYEIWGMTGLVLCELLDIEPSL